jgi:ABC-type phosphate transport system substrate-binding protein
MNNPDPLCAGKGLCLTQAQIVGIFVTCTITNWSQVGGLDAPIEVFAAQDGSGTRKTFDGFIGGSSDACIPAPDLATHKIFENENTSLFLNAHDAKNAIFYFSFGVWQNDILPNPDGSALGAIDGIAATVGTIADGSFPYGRYLYNVYCSACPTGIQASSSTKRYIGETNTGWICKLDSKHSIDPLTGDNYGVEIEKTITSEGFVNIPPGGPGTNKCKLFTT